VVLQRDDLGVIAHAHPCANLLIGIDTDPEHTVCLAFRPVAENAYRPRDVAEDTQVPFDLVAAG